MPSLKLTSQLWIYFLSFAGLAGGLYSCSTTKPPVSQQKIVQPRLLVFSKTAGWKHTSIPAGIAAIQKLGKENNFKIDTTKNSAYFTQDSLKHYNAVIFLSTTQNVLNAQQQVAFERYIQAGGNFVGIHAAADTEYEWPWYNKLVGAYFASHPNNPNVRKATVDVINTTHPSMVGLPARWERTDEWYNYKSIYPNITVLAKLDETSYEGGTNGNNHPIAWYHEFDGGRAFYTGGGHTDESFSEPLFLNHLLGGIKYAIGDAKPMDYSKSYGVVVPEENRFVKTTLSDDLNEPMELAVAPDGRVFFGERDGSLFVYEPKTRKTLVSKEMEVVVKQGNGLLGITLDPNFQSNNFIYIFYTPVPKDPKSRELLTGKTKADDATLEIVNKMGTLKHHISRFKVNPNNTLDLASEKVLIQIPIELEGSAHHGGSMRFDKNGHLFIATGDNTVPFQSNGHAPIDEIPGRIIYDAQRASANTNDLRGKVLRIHPEADGSYTIPEGNLFPKGTAKTRPEIYTMGLRNPYRLAVHPTSATLYWGEIGPDSGKDSPEQGPKGYDEFNQAKKPGNYGWPYFIGDTKPYNDYNFATKTTGPVFNASAPVNNSPNNTGLPTLPPAQKAMIWYPYDVSPEFPELGVGGRSAMAGDFYNFKAGAGSTVKFPEYYHNAMFLFDWMRNWVRVVRLDANENYVRTEDFLPVTGNFKRPIDLEFGQDGIMYMLEYGSIYGIDNEDARLVKIEYNAGNRTPVAKATVTDSIGLAPYKVTFSSKGSYDFDEEDKISYQWLFDGKTVGSTDANPSFTYTENGVYKAILKVTDKSGKAGMDTVEIKVGNTLPKVAIATTGNKSFYFDNTPLKYTVQITDKEDVKPDPKNIKVYFDFNPAPSKKEPLVGHQILSTVETNNLGKTLIANSDCKACHTIDKKSVGPAFKAVAQRYKGNKGAVDMLAKKIINGGGGNWGDHAMSAHPQISVTDASEMVKYILSLGEAQKQKTNLPAVGAVSFKEHTGKSEKGQYTLLASYTDKGGKMVGPLTNSDVIRLRNPRIIAADADRLINMQKQGNAVGNIHHKSALVLNQIDLTGIKEVTYNYASKEHGAQIELRLDSPTGPVVSTTNYKPTGDWKKKEELTATIQPTTGKHNLFFVVVKSESPNRDLLNLDWIQFKK